VVIARRSGRRWYVAGINASEPRRLDLDLSFVKTDHGVLIRDGENSRTLRTKTANSGRQALELDGGSGFVMIFDVPGGSHDP
jgi:hypothetical protein